MRKLVCACTPPFAAQIFQLSVVKYWTGGSYQRFLLELSLVGPEYTARGDPSSALAPVVMFNMGSINSRNCSRWASQFFCFDLSLYPLSSVFCPTPISKHADKSSNYCLYTNLRNNPLSPAPCPACCPGTAGHVHLEHTSFLALSVLLPCFPGCSLTLSLRGSLSFPSSNFLPGCHWTLSLFPISFSSPSYFWVNRIPAAIPTLQCSRLIL